MQRLIATGLALLCSTTLAAAGEWVEMFDGKTLNGWKVSAECPESFSVVDGAIVARAKGDTKNPKSHLFYEAEKPFDDFEFECEVMTKPGSNAGIYFHTKYQDEGWPKHGYEAQVNATHGDPKKSGSLYAVENVAEAPHTDGEWFPYHIKVQGRRIIITVNGKTTVDYTEPEGKEAGKDFTRVLTEGTIGLQAHDPKSEVHFRKFRIRRID